FPAVLLRRPVALPPVDLGQGLHQHPVATVERRDQPQGEPRQGQGLAGVQRLVQVVAADGASGDADRYIASQPEQLDRRSQPPHVPSFGRPDFENIITMSRSEPPTPASRAEYARMPNMEQI